MSETIAINLCQKSKETADEIFAEVPVFALTTSELLNELEELQVLKNDKSRNVYHEGKVPMTLGFLRRYMSEFPDKFIYNKDLVNYISGLVQVPFSLIDLLDTAVYLAQREKEKLIKKLRIKGFLADGFVDADEFPLKQGTKVIAMIQNPGASMCAFSEQEGTLKEIPNNGWWLIPPRSRNRGYPLASKEMYVKTIGRFSK